MQLNALSRGSFVRLDAAEGKEVIENLWDFNSLCTQVDVVPVRGNVEPPRYIIS
jgi:hypothetical protein